MVDEKEKWGVIDWMFEMVGLELKKRKGWQIRNRKGRESARWEISKSINYLKVVVEE